MPLARLDASGDKTDQGGLGTQDDAALPPLPLGEGGGEGHAASKTIAARASQTGAEGPNHSKPAANDAEALYWASLNQQAEQKAQALAIEGWGTGTDGPQRQVAQAKIAEVYYFHTDQVGLPEELSNSQGQLVWQATYKTWGNTQAEEWKLVEADGSKTHPLDAGDQPENEARQQNLRFQGQYLDRDTGLHYNTFRYYDPDIGRFISPDPIGLEGGINLGSYSPNPTMWIDPWGWCIKKNAAAGKTWEGKVTSTAQAKYGAPNVQEQVYIRPLDSTGKPANYRVRADNTIGAPGSNTPRIIDAKASPTAGMTTNQKKGYPLIEQYGGIIESGPSKGVQIGPTRVEIIRGPNGLPSI